MDFLVDDLQTPTMTKAHLADLLFDNLGLSKRESNDMIDAVFRHMLERLIEGEDIKLSSFSSFSGVPGTVILRGSSLVSLIISALALRKILPVIPSPTLIVCPNNSC